MVASFECFVQPFLTALELIAGGRGTLASGALRLVNLAPTPPSHRPTLPLPQALSRSCATALRRSSNAQAVSRVQYWPAPFEIALGPPKPRSNHK
jgi:hypothetical protein